MDEKVQTERLNIFWYIDNLAVINDGDQFEKLY